MPSKRLLTVTLSRSSARCGMSILLNDVSTTIDSFLHGIAVAIMNAIA
jgi:hypothetical protein